MQKIPMTINAQLVDLTTAFTRKKVKSWEKENAIYVHRASANDRVQTDTAHHTYVQKNVGLCTRVLIMYIYVYVKR